MNIGIYLDDYSKLGGVERVTSNLIDLLRTNYRVTTLISLHQSNYPPQIDYPSINLYVLNCLSEKKLSDIIEKEKLNILIVQIQNLTDSYFVSKIGKKHKCRIIPILHTSPYYYLKKYGSFSERFSTFRLCAQNLKMWFYWRYKHEKIFKDFIKNIGLIVFVSKQALVEFATLFQMDKGDPRLCYIYNPLSMPQVLIENYEKERCLLFAGRLSFEKQPLKMLRVWKAISLLYPTWKFIILGDGPLKKTIQKYIDRYCLHNVYVVGSVKDPYSYMKKSKIVLLCSYYEGLPTVLLEASLYKNALFGTTGNGGICDIIQTGFNGILLPPTNEDLIIRSLSELMADDKLIQDMGNNSYNLVINKFSNASILDKWCNILGHN